MRRRSSLLEMTPLSEVQWRLVLVLLSCLSGAVRAAESVDESTQLFVEMLEFLGEFTLSDGRWIDPDSLVAEATPENENVSCFTDCRANSVGADNLDQTRAEQERVEANVPLNSPGQ